MKQPDDGSSYSAYSSLSPPPRDSSPRAPLCSSARAPLCSSADELAARPSAHAWHLVALSLAIFFVVPVLFIFQWQHQQNLLLLITAIAALVSLFFCFRHVNLPGLAASLCLLLVLAHLGLITQQQVVHQLPTDVVVTARVLSIPNSNYRRSRALFAIESGKVCRFEWLPCRASLSWYRHKDKSAPTLIPGQRWQFTVRVKAPRGYANPGGFDYAQWLARRGVQASGYVRTGDSVESLPASRRGALSRWRLSVATGIESLIDTHWYGSLVGHIGYACGHGCQCRLCTDKSDVADCFVVS